ncbi:MAG TPA: hypothetical protein VMV56_07090 [Williamwhitmania sp.]|nr:hypothetical protein [Williamwhitmania sp.]
MKIKKICQCGNPAVAGQVMPMKSQCREGRRYGSKLAFNVVPVPKARQSNLKIENAPIRQR